MSTNQALTTLQDWALQPMGQSVFTHQSWFRTSRLNNWTKVKHWDNEHELVLIPGGWSGISREIALSLVKKGVRVVALDIQEPAFGQDENVAFYHADVTSSESIHAAATKIRAEHGHPTVVNNAGAGKNGPLLEKSEARFRQVFKVNTISHFLIVKKFLPDMIQKYHGRVVAIASMTSLGSLGRPIHSCCSKASALAFHEGLRQELSIWYDAPKVRASIFYPSWVRTPMTKKLTSAGEERFKQPVLGRGRNKAGPRSERWQDYFARNKFVISPLRALPYWMQRGLTAAANKELKADHDLEVKCFPLPQLIVL